MIIIRCASISREALRPLLTDSVINGFSKNPLFSLLCFDHHSISSIHFFISSLILHLCPDFHLKMAALAFQLSLTSLHPYAFPSYKRTIAMILILEGHHHHHNHHDHQHDNSNDHLSCASLASSGTCSVSRFKASLIAASCRTSSSLGVGF